MYVCICENITCNDIREVVDQGARNVRDLNKELALGAQCGKCVCVARKVIKEHLAASNYDLAVEA
jgi:bacterioferritin-associated ferredoxin